MSNPLGTTDNFFDSEDLMSWLLLNPEIVEFDESQLQIGPFSDEISPPGTDNENISTNFSCSGIKVSAISPAVPTSVKSDVTSKRTTNKSAKIKQEQTQPSKTAAKISKKRQRESIEDIEARVNDLRSENADLQAHLMNVTQRTTEVQKQRMAMEKLMVTKLAEIGDKEDSDQSELAKVVKQYTDIYADYGKCRQREVRMYCISMNSECYVF